MITVTVILCSRDYDSCSVVWSVGYAIPSVFSEQILPFRPEAVCCGVGESGGSRSLCRMRRRGRGGGGGREFLRTLRHLHLRVLQDGYISSLMMRGW